MTPEELDALGARIVLGNTFHLMLRPGADIVALHQDGLHGFMGWPRPILTDSGGFQVFSLARLRRIDEEGVRFRSPVDGAQVQLRPEDSMDVQRALASDIAMAFDDCTAYPASLPQAQDSMQRSMRWALRSYDHYYRDDAAPGNLFGIVQGGMYEELRLRSLEALAQRDFPGYAIGGLAVGEAEAERLRVLDCLALSDGRGLPAGHRRRRGARCGHVRLRDTHASRAQRASVHCGGQHQYSQRRLRARYRTDRSDLLVRNLQPLFARLPAASGPLRGSARRAARDAA
jgi:tRNA-guanine transglycosylase